MQSHLKLELFTSIPEVNLNIFKADNDEYYICTVRDYNLLMSSQIVQLLRPYVLNCQDVVTIQTKPLSQYQTLNVSSDYCIIRTIATSKKPVKNISYPLLEQPNMISGVSAGGK